jgi:hypothetical protein
MSCICRFRDCVCSWHGPGVLGTGLKGNISARSVGGLFSPPERRATAVRLLVLDKSLLCVMLLGKGLVFLSL